MMILLLMLPYVCLSFPSLKVAAIHSLSTTSSNFKVSELLTNYTDLDIEYQIFKFSDATPDFDLKFFSLLIDFTGSSILSSKLVRISHDYQIPIICVENCLKHSSNSLISAVDSCYKEFEYINKTLELLGWENYAVFYDESECSEEISLMLSPKSKFFVSYEMNELINILISKFLKTSGVKQWVLITEYLTSQVIEKKLKENNMIKSGNGLLAGPKHYFGLSEPGILQISKKDFEDFKTFEEFMAQDLHDLLKSVHNLNDNKQILQTLKKMVNETFKSALYNVKENNKTLIYELDCNDCEALNEVIYLGGSSTPPLSSITSVEMSLTAGITNPNNTFQISNQIMMNGVYVAIDYYNGIEGDLENFKFSYVNIPCYFSSLYVNTTCYAEYVKKFGLYHMSAHSEAYSILFYQFASTLNMNLFGTSDGIILADKNTYPLYISTGIPYKYEVNALVHIIKFLGFDKFAVLSTNLTNNIRLVGYAIEDAYENNMEIINDLTNYKFNVTANGSIFESDSVFEDLVKSKARIVYISCSAFTFNQVLSKISDLGLKQGDIYFATINLNPDILVNISDPEFSKRKKFIIGTLSLNYGNFIGDLGSYIESELITKYKTYSRRTCDYFDSFSLGYYGIKSLILQGKDYEKPSLIMSEARKARFVGCCGSIKVVDYTNLRESELYVIFQMSKNSSIYLNTEIARYYPSGSKIFEIVQPPYWNSYKTPTSIRTTDWNCPFDPDNLKTFQGGQIAIGIVCGVVGLFTIINTLIIWKKFWNKEIDDLTIAEEISFQDSVAMVTILMELIQTASMGPDLSTLFNVFQSIASALTYSIEDFISVENGVFWYILTSILILVAFWVLLCIVWIFQLHINFSEFWLFRFFGWSIVNLMPILGNLMFIPIISTLINVFLCDKSLDGTYKESVLDKDCHQKCWDSTHLPIAIISGIFIILYQPLAVYFRPLWQELLPLLHIKALPRYLMMKSVYQVILIILNKTLKRFSRGAHSIVYILLISIYSFIVIIKKSYNYTRIRLWHRLGSICLIALTFVCILNEYLYFNQALWIPVLLMTWIVIIIVGIRVQHLKYPSLLYRTANKDVEKIFRWMFNLEKSDSIFRSVKYELKDQQKEECSMDRMVISN